MNANKRQFRVQQQQQEMQENREIFEIQSNDPDKFKRQGIMRKSGIPGTVKNEKSKGIELEFSSRPSPQINNPSPEKDKYDVTHD